MTSKFCSVCPCPFGLPLPYHIIVVTFKKCKKSTISFTKPSISSPLLPISLHSFWTSSLLASPKPVSGVGLCMGTVLTSFRLEDIFIMLLNLNGSLSGYKILMESSFPLVYKIFYCLFASLLLLRNLISDCFFFLG